MYSVVTSKGNLGESRKTKMSTRIKIFAGHMTLAFYYIIVQGHSIDLQTPGTVDGLKINNPYS